MHIFFDVDGVLFSNLHMERGWINRWSKDIEKDLGVNQEHLEEIFTDWFPLVQTGNLDFEAEMARWLKSRGYTVTADEVIAYWNEKDMSPNTDLWPAIHELSQNPAVHMYVATNQNHVRAGYLWQNRLKDHFVKMFYSAALGCLKSDGDFFRQIEEELGINPAAETILFFDDDKRNVAVSSERGWQSVYFHTAADCLDHPLIKPLLVS